MATPKKQPRTKLILTGGVDYSNPIRVMKPPPRGCAWINKFADWRLDNRN